MKKYPIGIQTFSEVVGEGYFYVDKTKYVQKMATEGKFYFLSRPRRFGKSLFLDTLRQAFLGNREPFQGLFLEHNWDWETKYPVLKLSWGAGVLRSPDELRSVFTDRLRNWSDSESIELKSESLKERFAELIENLHLRHNRKVVVLVDEYDKPILDNIAKSDVAVAMREELKNLYSVLKDADEHLKFVFITGVSKFSKVSLFSGLNNLEDISHSPGYGALCGYTQAELESVFAPALEGVALAEVKRWYNGYRFAEEEGVYNPFDVLLYLKTREFRNYWFETATPTFLIELLAQKRFAVPDLESITASEEILGAFELEKLSLATLLFQTGYLTIDSVTDRGGALRYRLRLPNQEVKQSLSNHLLTYFVDEMEVKLPNQDRLWDALHASDLDRFREVFQGFFESIPFEWYTKNRMASYEGYYASIFYCYFTAMGLDTHPEESTSHGRLDMAVRMEHATFVFEFKVVDLVKDTNPALEQIRAKGYHKKYLGQTRPDGQARPVYLVGVEFHAQERNIVRLQWEKVDQDV
ncbi:MAG: ATP-binding protein [Fibrobacteres bacterium]|nr:ATP-binding protein [Fibrobacterota bacterium]